MPARRSVARNAASLLGAQATTAVLGISLTLIQPRLLGPAAQGQLRVAVSIWTVVDVITGLGTSTYLTLRIARDPLQARSLFRETLRIRLLAYSAAWPLVLLYLHLSDRRVDGLLVIVMVGVGTMFAAIGAVSRAVLYGLQAMGETSRLDVIIKVIGTIGIVGVLLFGFRLHAVATVLLGTGLVTAWLYARAVQRQAPANTPHVARAVILRGSMVFFVTDAAATVYGQIDTLLMSALSDDKAIGYYAVSDVLVATLLFVPTIMLTAMFPEIARLHEQEPEALEGLLRRCFLALVPIGVLLGAGTVLVSDHVAVLFYGPSFAKAGPVLAVFGVVMTLGYMTILLGRFALATGQAHFWNRLMITGIVLSIPLDLVLIPWTDHRFHNGALGGAIAFVVTEGMMVCAGIIKLDRGLLDRGALVRYAKCAVSAAALLGVGWPLRDRSMALVGAAGSAAFVVVFFGLRTLTAEETAILRGAVRRITRRNATSSLGGTE